MSVLIEVLVDNATKRWAIWAILTLDLHVKAF